MGIELDIRGLTKTFPDNRGDRPILKDISLTLRPGEIAAILGPSGCGKTTLFNILAGLISADSGEIILGGRPVQHLRGSMAYMQQKDLLLPWRNTLDNAALGLEVQGWNKDAARREAQLLMAPFGLTGFEKHFPHQLSGGLRQRTALLRTMLCRKNVLLLDEPFGALDAITRFVMQKWLLRVWADFGPSILLVTHDVEEALLLADRIYVLTPRPASIGRVVTPTIGRPRTVTHPELVEMKGVLLSHLETQMNNGEI